MIGCAILGATGAVGQRFIERLTGHPELEIRALCASSRSAGKRYRDATTWLLDSDIPSAVADQPVGTTDDLDPATTPVVFSALPTAQAGPIEQELADRGFMVFTNASPHRMDADVPLLIPEVNPEHVHLIEQQGPGAIIANGNCSGIILTLALAPLHRAFGLQEVDVTTMQGLSGAGYPGVPSMDVIDNVIPFIGGEEDKLETEPQKTLGAPGKPANFTVRPTCTRVPVREGHLESVHVRLGREASVDEVRAAFSEFRGPAEIAGLHSAPERPIHVLDGDDRPQPRRDRDREDGMAISVGRIRVDGDRVRFIVLGHNTVRGAAGQSVLNAEFVIAKGLLDRAG